MLQSGEYIFTPEFITFYKKLDLEETTVMWEMIHTPSSTTLDMILKLIFNPRSYSPRELEKCRYFLIAASNLSSSMSSSQYTAQTSHTIFEEANKSKANRIIETIRNANVVNISTQQNIDTDYVPLPNDDDCSENSSIDLTQSCPAHIDDMMVIVRKLRTQQYSVNGPIVNSTISSSSCTPASETQNHKTPQEKQASIYDTFCLSNLFRS